jgi:hypothetical protein
LEPFKVENWRCMQLANCPHSPPRHRGENWNGVKVNPMRFNKSYVIQPPLCSFWSLYMLVQALLCTKSFEFLSVSLIKDKYCPTFG